MSEIIAKVTRGEITECIQRGDAVVVDSRGKILFFTGDPYKESFIRSSAKPLQTLEVFRSGAADFFGFTQREISIMCASHYGEKMHTDTVKGILRKIGLRREDLMCGSVYSMKSSISSRQTKEGFSPSEYYSCCSGKHSGMLAICRVLDMDRSGYYRPEHPLQQGILHTISHMCGIEKEKIGIGIDGCGVPVFSMPIYNMALGYARFSAGTDEIYGRWCSRIYDSMAAEPEMLAGTRGFCSDLTRSAKGRFVGKLGADGIYCIGVRDLGIGIALKVESGDTKCIPPVIMDILSTLGLIDESQEKELFRYTSLPNKNNLGDEVGDILSTINLTPFI